MTIPGAGPGAPNSSKSYKVVDRSPPPSALESADPAVSRRRQAGPQGPWDGPGWGLSSIWKDLQPRSHVKAVPGKGFDMRALEGNRAEAA